MSSPDPARWLFDFRDPGAVAEWRALDDRVMGGVSRSWLRHDATGHAVFEGEVSLERGGGFASVRSSPGPRGLAGATVCLLEVRGPARTFKLSLLGDDRVDGIGHQAEFSPSPGWQVLRIPLAGLRARFRGREVPGAAPLDPARIRQVGLLIAESQAGPFALGIRRIGLA